MKSAISALLLTTLSVCAAEPVTIKLWPQGAPEPAGVKIGPEEEIQKGDGIKRVTNVTDPTITIYKPEKANGTSVIVCPGGGYSILAIEHEGTKVCEYLNTLGVTSVLLKYRVPRREPANPSREPLQDAQRAIGILRHRAAEFGLKPDRIGILGFSAGGHLSVMATLHANDRTYAQDSTLDVADATLHWLRPAPQLEGAEGVVRFGLDEILVQLSAARLAGTRIQARDGTARFLDPFGDDPRAEIEFDLAGTVPEVLGVLQHPRLRLFERRPLQLRGPQGMVEGRVTLGFPLLHDLAVEQMRIGARAQLRQVRLAEVVLGHGIDRGTFDLQLDNSGLRASGTARLADIQARIAVAADFRTGPPGQVVTRERVTARADGSQLAALGLGSEEVLRGPVALDIRSERRRNGQGRVTLRADLREAELALEPLAWSKPAGQNGGAEAVLRLAGETLEAVESFRVEAPSLLLRGNAAFGRGMRLERVTVNEGRIEDSRFGGEARPPARPGEPWIVMLRGQLLDLRRIMADQSPAAPASDNAPGPAVSIDGRFERVLLAPGRELAALEARVLLDGRGVLREGRVSGRTGPEAPFALTVTPQAQGRALAVTAEDAGALLRAFGILRSVQGGRLRVTAAYAHDGRGAPLSGRAEIDDFAVRDAPSVAKLLQAMTVYGLLDAFSGPDVGFARLVAPFTLTPETLVLEEARAFSASLGLTAKGSIDRQRQHLRMEGTIVPAYLLNTLLGNLPIIGRLFSPETSGGLFAAIWRVQGPMDDPQVSVNPLAALTPGFLRGLFDIGQQQPDPPPR